MGIPDYVPRWNELVTVVVRYHCHNRRTRSTYQLKQQVEFGLASLAKKGNTRAQDKLALMVKKERDIVLRVVFDDVFIERNLSNI